MDIGIVGSRKRLDKGNVIKLVDSLNDNDTVISGGCRGVDSWAEERAKERGLKVIVFKPDLSDIKNKGDMIHRYYTRNKLIANECDVLYAFVSSNRKGGTENTIKHAKELNKEVIIK